MEITPDTIVIWQHGPFLLNATIVFTWLVMVLLSLGSWLITRKLSTDIRISRWQNVLEVVVEGINNEIRDISRQKPDRYLPFVGTIFLFVALSNIFSIVPGYRPPTGSLSTTAALAICVFVAVPVYGIIQQGFSNYFKQYIKPTVLMLPFNIISELSRTLALAIRLFGNIMSGTVIAAMMLAIAPLFFPVVMQALGLIIGLMQAYIFAILSMVYIAAGTGARYRKGEGNHKHGA
ncbi:MAG: F0F1 ATP synthase subunit A [Deltaproteobacteria bacterium]|nr:F0F1 ATP synthase subunit A [Deltaproteobacteria bacterium]RLB90971.1 MAG: F0F1 ATP synthase subunit A [Deltaproteobacteria bacterium]RLB93516.1 MAG: F0F1 ATP synthase subunit A [Deltaproteobacteria bacterium]RLC10370.1 MAG: F0F1 ATP synthase subunit A [Deltaproteobacteria bacterium]